MNGDTDKRTDSDDELLTSYLDGELSDERQQEVEKRLSEEPKFRDKLHGLQSAWDMLDELPRGRLQNSFTQSTIELVVADARRETKKAHSKWTEGLLKFAIFGIVPAFVCWGSWLGVRYWQELPQRQMIDRLPLVDDVDVYLKADSIEFLTQLQETGLFDKNDEFESFPIE